MSSRWDQYFLIVLSALVAVIFPLLLSFMSRLFSSRMKPGIIDRSSLFPPRTTQPKLKKINLRFFTSVSLASVFLSLTLLLVPCVVTVRTLIEHGESKEAGRVLLSIISVSGLLLLGVFYSVSKGDLNWIRTIRASHLKTGRGNGIK